MKSLIITGFAVAAILALIGLNARADDKTPTSQPADDGIIRLADFEQDSDAKLVKAGDDNVTIAIDASHATHGSKSLKVTCAKGNDFGPIDFIGDAIKGWAGPHKDNYKYLAIDFTTDADVTVPAHVEVWDAKSTNYKTRATIEDGVATLKKGVVTVFVPLADFKRNDNSGPMDLTQITKLRVLLVTKDLKDDLVTYLDNVRLTAEEPK